MTLRPAVGAVCLGCFAVAATVEPSIRDLFIDRRVPAGFEPWRFFTGHLVHASWTHLAWNLLLFVPLAVSRERRAGLARFLLEYVALAGCVAVGIRTFHDDWSTYCGLSGVVYGLIIIVVFDRQEKQGGVLLGLGVAVLLAAKTALEAAEGGWVGMPAVLEESMGVEYLWGAHAGGMAGGMAVAMFHRARLRRTPS